MKTNKSKELKSVLGNQSFFRDFINDVYNGFAILDTDYNVIYTNKWLQEKYKNNLPFDGKKCHKAFQNEEEVCSWCPSKKVIEDGKIHSEIVPFKNESEKGHLQVTAYPIKNNKDIVIGIAETFVDVSEFKKTANKYKETEERFKNIFENSIDGILISTQEGQVLSANPAACEMFKMTENEVKKAGRTFLVDTDDNRFLEMIEARRKTGKARARLTMFDKNKKPIPVSVATSLFKDNYDNELICVLVRDETKQQNVETKLIKKEKEISSLMQTLPGLTYQFKDDENWTMIFLNDACKQLTGYDKEDILNNKKIVFGDIVHPDDRKTVRKIIKEAIARKDSFEIEYRIITASGVAKWVWEKGFYSREEKGCKIISGLIHDITNRKKAENELVQSRVALEKLVTEGTKNIEKKTANLEKSQKALTFLLEDLNESREELIVANEMAEAANRSKSIFLAKMSHDIRTPINAILGYAQLLSSQVKDELDKKYLQPIMVSGQALLSLIDDILDLSKIEVGKLDLNKSYTDISLLLTNVRDLFLLDTEKKGISLTLEIDKKTPPQIFCDEARIRQVLINLLSNAVKFTKQGLIKMSLEVDNLINEKGTDESITEKIDFTIKVEDSGIGISKEDQQRIFESFSQVNLDASLGGTGLGLAITSNLVELMGGKIDVQSSPGEGSTFSVSLFEVPYTHEDVSTKTVAQSIDIANVVFEPATVMVLDDNYINRKILEEVVKGLSLSVIEAENGADALEKIKSNKPDLILADVQMPIMDGFEFVSKVKDNKDYKEIPVIACTALAMKEEREKINKHSFDGLLIKPIQIEMVYTELMKYLPYKVK